MTRSSTSDSPRETRPAHGSCKSATSGSSCRGPRNASRQGRNTDARANRSCTKVVTFETSPARSGPQVTLIPHQAHLIAGTVTDDIRLLRDDVTQDMIEEASRLANLHDDVSGFAEGYERQGSHLIRQTLNTLREKMTVIIVAHRLSTLKICDRIMVIQDGELKGFDTPENLETTNDFYRDALIVSGVR